MRLYTPVLTNDQLPIQFDPESETLDFKKGFGGDQGEKERICKSVAAFANAAGGTLIIGAEERSDHLVNYAPVASPNVEQKRIQDVTNEFLSPRWTVHPIELTSKIGPVVVVNVDPSPTPIAYYLKGSDSWRVPIRTGRDTHFMTFEEVERMIAPVRRAVILLSRIPPDSWVILDHALPRSRMEQSRSHISRLSVVHHTGAGSDAWRYKGSTDEVAVLELHRDSGVSTINVPLASIEAVWTDARWDRVVITTRAWLYEHGGDYGVSMAQML